MPSDSCSPDGQLCVAHACGIPQHRKKLDDGQFRQSFCELLEHAPPEARAAIIALLPAARLSLNRGYKADAHAVPLHNWRELLSLLSDAAAMRHDPGPLLRVTNDLLNIADEMASAEGALYESAQILVRFFHADLFLCRLRDEHGDWRVTAAERTDGGPVPIFTPILEEGLAGHPVMHAVCSGIRHVVSNDLRAMERGGESVDCMAYKAGCRSRLAFVLRERKDKPPFGLVLLYSEKEYAFDGYDSHFLAKCARIVALTTGRRLSVARDALEKAAGAVAHHGNNALAILRNYAELCAEILDDVHDEWEDAMQDIDELIPLQPADSPQQETARHLRERLERMNTIMLTEYVDGVIRSSRRIQRIISALEESARQPKLMHYVLGRHVLDLGDTSAED